MNVIHLSQFSGGATSWKVTKDLVIKFGPENVKALFTDTLIEDEDLYRFNRESIDKLGIELITLTDGRTPWEVFKDARWIGNSQVAQCSHELKQKMAMDWVKANYQPDEVVLYFGIDWTEIHRVKNIVKHWAPYQCEFPLVEQSLTKKDIFEEMERDGIRKPRLYDMEFTHNNCFRGDTKFLTSEGIFELREMVDQEVDVLGINKGWKKATIKHFGKQKIWKLMVQRYRDTKEIYTTENHRWFIRSGRTKRIEKLTNELQPGQSLFSMFADLQGNIKPSPFGIAHGITFGDGSGTYTTNGPTTLTLCGDKDLQLLKWFPNCDVKEVPGVGLKVCDLPRMWKHRPPIDESKSFLYGWLSGYFAADGTWKSGQAKLSSAKRENLEFVKSVCSKVGIATNMIRTELRKGFNEEKSPLYSISLVPETLREDFFLIEEHRKRFMEIETKRAAEWKVLSVEETDVIDDVYCAVVPDGHAFTLDDNIFTGNCGGFCVRAGKGHFINLLKQKRKLFLHHENEEQKMREYLGRNDVSILSNQVFSHYKLEERYGEIEKVAKYKKVPLTLRELREEWESGLGLQIDMDDIGGCGCFTDYDEPKEEIA